MKALIRFIGYILFFILSLVPAGLAYLLDAGGNEVGLIYLGTLLWASLIWGAIHTRGVIRYLLFVLLAALPAGAGYLYHAPTAVLIQLYAAALLWTFAFWGLYELITRHEREY